MWIFGAFWVLHVLQNSAASHSSRCDIPVSLGDLFRFLVFLFFYFYYCSASHLFLFLLWREGVGSRRIETEAGGFVYWQLVPFSLL
jgi:hypothetical protein